MTKFFAAVKKFGLDDEGVTAIEYGLIAALVAVAIGATVKTLGVNMNTLFAGVAALLVLPI